MTAACAILVPVVAFGAQAQECVRRCLGLDHPDFEVLLLADRPIELPEEFRRARISVHVTGEVSIGAKRNAGIRLAQGAEHVALIDSDAYPRADWLGNGTAFLAAHPEAWAVGGPNLSPPGEPIRKRVVGNAQKSFLVSGPLAFAKRASESRYCDGLHSCNLILPMHALAASGGFDEALFSGEDRNLCDRIRERGGKIAFRSDVVVYHHDRSLWLPFFSQRFTYGHGAAAIARRYPNFRNLAMFLPLAWLAFFAGVAAHALLSPNGSPAPAGFLLAACLLAMSAEAVRHSGSLREVPATAAAILLCYLATTAGQLAGVLGLRIDLKKVYTAHQQAPAPPPGPEDASAPRRTEEGRL